MARTSSTPEELLKDSSETRKLTSAINKMTLYLVILNIILILLTIPVTIESLYP